MPQPLEGKRILIVEDEALVAMEIEMFLEAAGGLVAGPVAESAQALDLLKRERPDAAILDLNLDGEQPTALAQALVQLRVPFVIVTGYFRTPSEPPFQRAPRLRKPATEEDLINALCRAMGLGTA
jgi:CheY-like chemotaxis protein